MNALKTLHGEIATRAYERLADHYDISEITYRAEEAEADFINPEGWLQMTVLNYSSDDKPSCYLFLNHYNKQHGDNYERILAEGTPEQLYAAINKLIEGKTA
ncbi:hypothetical protein [Cardiobacterium hominis]|jgi:hypothetical protein|uniref:hypothetical protein n=1 Tax=Cardiobacterium hominis TaxID=2718 RepID=UPI000660F748|nr:hypothetical protein [Cardiobacterium hominis]